MKNLKITLIDQVISITVDKLTDSCEYATVNILFSFRNFTKLVRTEHLTVVDNSSIAQLIMRTIIFLLKILFCLFQIMLHIC